MVVADLHVHTTTSDGQLSLQEVPTAAKGANVEAVAVTDHDRPHPGLADPVTRRDGILIIHGIELRVQAPSMRVDLLGYGLSPTPALRAESDRLARDRRERGAAMIDRVEEYLDIDLDLTATEHTGRPHIAQAIAEHPACPHDVAGAFEELIGEDCPCYIPRSVPSFKRGRELLAEACSFVGLAHPFRYSDPEAALDLATKLDAIERYYPYEMSVDPAPIDTYLDRHDLLATGGSDAHDGTLGRAGLDRPAFAAVCRRLGIDVSEGNP